MKLLDLNQFDSFKENRDVKVVRHKEMKFDLWEVRRDGGFDRYQKNQSWDVFVNAQFLISFIAERYRYAKFVGVWQIFSTGKQKSGKGFAYRTKELPGFDSLESRLIIDWGGGTRSWAQWLHRQGNKDIIELLPTNYVKDFPGYYNITLTLEELTKMIKNPDSNREWGRMLSSVSGIYLILDQSSGKQYVGSAYGAGGIWSRWKSYARTPSGGNLLLKNLLRKRPSAHKQFQFSLLRVLEPTATREEVLKEESLTKKKLGSRAFGLNIN